MAQGKFVAYYRVSTARQGRSGLGLDAQKNAVRDYLNGGQWKLVEELIEIESGKRNDRPRIAEALRLCRMHAATLIIAKLDRLARNVAFVSALMESGVEFIAVDFPKANNLTVHILAAVAEFEAKMISDRTKAALAAARKRGVKLGGDRGSLPAVARQGALASAVARAGAATARARDVAPTIIQLQAQNRSLRRIAEELTTRGIPAARGGAWSASTVSRLLRRL